MKPNDFVALALTALAMLMVAIATYVSATPWSSRLAFKPEPLLPAIASRASEIAAIEVRQGQETARLEKTADAWRIASEGGYPADPEKVRALILAASEADVVEKKTAKPERHASLGVADPETAGTSSALVRFLDASQRPLGELIVGRTTLDAFEASKGGTYVRRPGDNQTYLANRQIDASLSLRDWANTKLVDVRPYTLTKIRIEPQSAEAYDIKRGTDGKSHELAKMPAGKKLKFVGGVDDIAEAISLIEFKGVAKAGTADKLPLKGKASFMSDSGLEVAIEFRSDDKEAWIRITPSGTGAAKGEVDSLKLRTVGYEFEVPVAEVNAVLVTLADLLEDAPA